MKVKRIEDQRPGANATVTVKTCGNVVEVRYIVNGSPKIAIEKLDKDTYMDLRTGEVKAFNHTKSRAENKNSAAQSLRDLRDLINTNLTDPATALWVTLTYKENMRDPQKLYEDFHAYIKRLRRYLKREGQTDCEYIAAAEPQGRGAWHLHVLLLFTGKAPYIDNSEMARLWGHGYTKTKGLNGVDNPGLYLTAYLGNMEYTEAVMNGVRQGQIAEAETVDEQGKRRKKAVIKGARLYLYPRGFNMYRSSRGVKRPKELHMTEEEAREIVGTAPLTYEKTLAVLDKDEKTVNIINFRQYNRARTQSGSEAGTVSKREKE